MGRLGAKRINPYEFVGKSFNRLTIKEYVGVKNTSHFVRCKCSCGNKKEIHLQSILRNTTKSCGCLNKELIRKRMTSHGDSYERLYEIYRGMKNRCTSDAKSSKGYKDKGIKVCDEWLNDYQTFKKWALENGYDDSLSIDRIDNNGNYEPNNCRWATNKQQSNNRGSNFVITYKGETKNLTAWAKELGFEYNTLRVRLRKLNWTVEEAFEIPVYGVYHK